MINKIRNEKLLRAFDRLADEIEKRDSSANLNAMLPHLEDSPAYQVCLDELEKDLVIKQHFDKNIQFGIGGFRGGAVGWSQYMISVMQAARREGDGRAAVKTVYGEFENFFYNEGVECIALAPVQGLGVFKENETLRTATSTSYDDEHTPLVFADELQLAPLDQGESATVHQIEIVRRHHLRWSEAIYAIKVNFRARKLILEGDDDSQTAMETQTDFEQKIATAVEKINEVLIALRLYKPGRVLVGGVLVKARNQLFGHIRTIPQTLGNPFFDVHPYTLDLAKEGAGLIQLHSVFARVKAGSRKNLIVAARWFNKSCEADSLEDRVIALLIAAEALAQTVSQKHKGVAIAAFVADLFPSEKAEVEEHLLGFYRLRNDIVHQGSMDGWAAKNLTLPDEIFGYIGRSTEIIRDALVIVLTGSSTK